MPMNVSRLGPEPRSDALRAPPSIPRPEPRAPSSPRSADAPSPELPARGAVRLVDEGRSDAPEAQALAGAVGRRGVRRALARAKETLQSIEKKKVGAAVAAALLLPGIVVAEGVRDSAPPPRSNVVTVIDPPAAPEARVDVAEARRAAAERRAEEAAAASARAEEAAAERRAQAEARAEAARAREIGPRPQGRAARAGWYRRIVEQQGLRWRDGANQVNVVGLRGYDVDRGVHRNAFGPWNDTIAFVWKGTDGKWNVREYRGTTDPGMKSHPESPDVNRDGRGDVAWMRPGQYPYQTGTHRGTWGAGVPELNVPVFRDTNANGQIEAREERASRSRGDVGYGINLHWGPGWDSGAVGPYSLGCQVVTESAGEFQAEITPILQRNRGQLLYALVDAHDIDFA
jgi:hypothetical protein